MTKNENALNWFEIPTEDIGRAKLFFETVFDITMTITDFQGLLMATFPSDDSTGLVCGALAKSEYHKPSVDGPLIYLNGNPDLAGPLGRVEAAGGKVLMPKTFINENVGYMALFIDTEGNRLAMHSFK